MKTAITLSLVAGALSCGGTGKLSLQITDAPPDTNNMSAVIVTLTKVDAHVVDKNENKDGDPADKSIDGDNKWHTTTPQKTEYDLLRLQNDTKDALADLDLPDGKITQIRLFISPSGRNEVQLKDGRTCALNVAGVDQTGIKINHPFKAIDVDTGGTVSVVLDFALADSVVKDGDCAYRLNPVIKIKGDPVQGKK